MGIKEQKWKSEPKILTEKGVKRRKNIYLDENRSISLSKTSA